jgi:hypothetical protein
LRRKDYYYFNLRRRVQDECHDGQQEDALGFLLYAPFIPFPSQILTTEIIFSS